MAHQDEPSQEYILSSASKMIAHAIAKLNIEVGMCEQSEGKTVDLSTYGVNEETIKMYLDYFELTKMILQDVTKKQQEMLKK